MFTDRVFQPVRPFGRVGPVFRSLTCPRCGTPLALIGVTTTAGFFDTAIDLRQRVQHLLQDLQRLHPTADLAAYLLVREASATVGGQLREVWPADPSRSVSAQEWATVRPTLQQRHRCSPLTTLVRS